MTWTCRECTAAYAVGLPACPHCGSTDHEETGMSKITVAAGLTHPDTDLTEHDDKGGEQPSAGTSSSTSSEAEPKKSGSSGSSRSPRARTTASRSKPGRTGSSSAGSTDGEPTAHRGTDKN